MAEFKRVLEELGYTDVKTLLNSGNAVFTSAGRSSPKHARAIATAVQTKFGVSTPVIIKSAAELSAVVKGNPMSPPEADYSRFLVVFGPDDRALPALRPLQSLAQSPERFVITNVAAYLYCPDGLLESKVGAALLGKAGKDITTRNWGTVLKLAALADAG